jgi:hypothetical protein
VAFLTPAAWEVKIKLFWDSTRNAALTGDSLDRFMVVREAFQRLREFEIK